MAIDSPTLQEIIDRMRTDVQGELPALNPALRNSFIDSIIISTSGRVNEFYEDLDALIEQMFPDTATGEFLERWGEYVGITRNPATQATGLITATGTATSVIPALTSLQTNNGTAYTTNAEAIISSNVISITSITRIGTTATATTASAHNLASNNTPTIAGADQSAYNGVKTINVIAENQFTFEVSGSPTTPATGTITSTLSSTSISVTSEDFGQAANAASGTRLTFTSPISGVDSSAYVQFTAIGGGADIETDNELRTRIIARYRNPITAFNAANIINQAKLISGNTRVWVQEAGYNLEPLSVTSITRSGNTAIVEFASVHSLTDGMTISVSGANETEYNVTNAVIIVEDTTKVKYNVLGSPSSPATGTIIVTPTVRPGQVRVFFTRDNDASIIPDGSEVNTTKAKIKEIAPVNTSDNDLIVAAPTAVTVDFTFTSLVPNTSTMQASITANLTALFRDSTDVGQDLTENQYKSVIYQTVDTGTGQPVQSFTLSAPSGDVAINSSELPILGTINY